MKTQNAVRFALTSTLLTVALMGCNGADAPVDSSSTQVQTTTTTSGAAATTPQAVFRTAQINDGAGHTVAYVVGLQNFGQMLLYVPASDVYVRVDSATGQYVMSTVYYSGAGCTGTAFLSAFASSAWYGQMNKAIVYDGVNFFRVTGSGYANTSNANRMGTTSCSNATTAVTGGYSVTDATQPYDFTTIAPLQITYSQ